MAHAQQSAPDTPDVVVFSHDFEPDLIGWTDHRNSDWQQRIMSGPDGAQTHVLYSEDCDKRCVIFTPPLGLSDRDYAYVELDRFVSDAVDKKGAFNVHVKDGSSKSLLLNIKNDRGSQGQWVSESIAIPAEYLSNSVQIRLAAKSHNPGDVIMVDNLRIRAAASAADKATPQDATVAPDTSDLTILFHDFDSELIGWKDASETAWQLQEVAGADGAPNSVLYSEDCDVRCSVLSMPLDLSGHNSAYVELDRFISDTTDNKGSFIVRVKSDAGWDTLVKIGKSERYSYGKWVPESVAIPAEHLLDSTRIQLMAKSHSAGDVIMVDNLRVRVPSPAINEAVPPGTGGPASVSNETTPPGTGTEEMPDVAILANDFESDLDGWRHVKMSHWVLQQEPGNGAANQVLHAENCDRHCSIVTPELDLSGHDSAYVELDRFVSDALDRRERFNVQIHHSNVGWDTLLKVGKPLRDLYGQWVTESIAIPAEYLLDGTKIRLAAKGNDKGEVIMIDNFRVMVPAPVTDDAAPPETDPSPGSTLEAGGTLVSLGPAR